MPGSDKKMHWPTTKGTTLWFCIKSIVFCCLCCFIDFLLNHRAFTDSRLSTPSLTTAQYSTVLPCIAMEFNILYCTVLHCTTFFLLVLYVLYQLVFHCTVCIAVSHYSTALQPVIIRFHSESVASVTSVPVQWSTVHIAAIHCITPYHTTHWTSTCSMAGWSKG